MSSPTIRRLSLLAVAIAAAAGLARAAEPITEVYVEAPKLTRSTSKEQPLGAPVDLASIKYRVSYADLDLATPIGARTLEDRINDAARRACHQLEASLPPNSIAAQGDPPCVKTAVDGAMKQAKEAIAAASKKR
jgi:UrcA family protein